jgi:hypothetical protein
MTHKILRRSVTHVALFLGVMLVVIGVWFLQAPPDENVVHDSGSLNQASEPQNQTTQPAQTEIVTTVSSASSMPAVVQEAEPAEANPFLEAETKARLIQIADTFADEMQYPVYSKPIRSREELQKYIPNTSSASSIPLDSKNPQSPNINLKTSKLQYFRGEPILAQAYVDGASLPESIDVSARLVSEGSSLIQTFAKQSQHQVNRFFITIDSSDIPASLESAELRLIAEFDLDGVRYEIGAPIQYVNAAAAVDYVGAAQVLDSVLHIPVYVTTSAPGYHQLSAILFDAQTGQPLIHLNAEKELLVERDFIPLQAHIVALKAAGHEGPYLLKNFSLIRMPSEPDFTTSYGRVPASDVPVNGFSFSEYRDEPYVDQEAQERLEFLKKLGGEV